MKVESDLNRHIYEYFETRILSGYYRYGDSLPSIYKISAGFHVAISTVRAALSILERQGYICVDARKAAKVIYQIPESSYRQRAAEYFVPRADGIAELTQAGKLLLMPCWEAGLEEWKKEDWSVFQETLLHSYPDEVIAPCLVLYLVGLSSLHNRLLVNLFWEIIHYIRFPFLARNNDITLPVREDGHSQHDIAVQLSKKLENTYKNSVQQLQKFINESRTQYSLQQAQPIPFRWRVYRHKPQMRYSLASHIIRGIMYGEYPLDSNLPSLSQLAKLHNTSVNTVRRTLNLLDKLGVVELHQGRKAVIRMKAVPFDVNDHEISEGLRQYLDALQIMELTVQPVILHILNHVSSSKQESLRETFGEILEQGKSDACFEVIFAFIEENCPLEMIRESYSILLDMLTWGFPLTLYRLSGCDLPSQYLDFMIRAEKHLSENDFMGFSFDWKELLTKERLQARAFIAEKGGMAFHREDIPMINTEADNRQQTGI